MVDILPARTILTGQVSTKLWADPFVSLRVGGRDVQTFCVPTGTGIVLILRTSDGVMRCLPTWGATAGAFGAAPQFDRLRSRGK